MSCRSYQHSLGVAKTAYEIARAYDVDCFSAALAGLLHDWDKVLDDHELLVRAAQYGVRVAGSPSAAVGLLHGPVASYELPHIFEGWDKVLDDHELLVRAAQYGVRVAGSPSAAVGLLHGPVASYELPHIFEGIDASVCQAVARHTVGAVDMTPLDMARSCCLL